MKKVFKIALGIAGLYGLLMIPLPEKEWEPPKGPGTPFVWDRDALWSDLEKTFKEAKAMQPKTLDSLVNHMSQEIDSVLDEQEGMRVSLKDSSYYLKVNSMFFRIAPLIAAQKDKTDWYIGFYDRVRKKLKEDARYWPLSPEARQLSYKALYGMRMAVEEIMLQSTDAQFEATTRVTDEASDTPEATILGIKVHSGDLLVSRSPAELSAFIARGNDYPGNFSHVALIYIDEKTLEPYLVEAHIEKGVAIRSVDEYLQDKKLRFMVMRPRKDLEQLQENPMLPHQAALGMYNRSKEEHIPYDFTMNYLDPSAMFCSEVGFHAYKPFGIHLWKYTSTITPNGIENWYNDFGVEHFETTMPADLEYDTMMSVVAEWRDRQTLFEDHLDDAVMDALIARANKGEKLGYNIWMLPVARVLKGYSLLLNAFHKVGKVPEGMSAKKALMERDFVARFDQLKSFTRSKAEAFEREKGYTPPYWDLVSFAESGNGDEPGKEPYSN